MYSVQCTVNTQTFHHMYLTMATCCLYCFQNVSTMYIMNCTLYICHCTAYTVRCTVYIMRCTVYSVQRTLDYMNIQRSLYSVYNTACNHIQYVYWVSDNVKHLSIYHIHCILNVDYCTVYTINCKLFNVQYTVYTVQCTLYSVKRLSICLDKVKCIHI